MTVQAPRAFPARLKAVVSDRPLPATVTGPLAMSAWPVRTSLAVAPATMASPEMVTVMLPRSPPAFGEIAVSRNGTTAGASSFTVTVAALAALLRTYVPCTVGSRVKMTVSAPAPPPLLRARTLTVTVSCPGKVVIVEPVSVPPDTSIV